MAKNELMRRADACSGAYRPMAVDGKPPMHVRYVKKNGEYNIKRLHPRKKVRYVLDPFHTLANMPWWRVIIWYSLFYLTFWFFWGCYYFIFDQTIREDKTTRSLWDCFFFSVQTGTTIGYGGFSFSDSGYVGATLESLSGYFFDGLFLGLVYSKFARAQRGHLTMLISKVAVIQLRDGIPTLIFRVTNVRKHVLIDTYIKLYFGWWRKTREGVWIYDVHQLQFEDDKLCYPLVGIPFEVVYPLAGPKCPIAGWTKEDIRERGGEFIVLLEGMPDVTSQTLQVRTSFIGNEIKWNREFKSCMTLRGGTYCVDLDKLSDIEKIPRSQHRRRIEDSESTSVNSSLGKSFA